MIILDTDFKMMMYHLYDALENNYDCIIGLKRGGLVPAVYLSHKFNIPMYVADITNIKSNGDNVEWHDDILPEIEPGKRILLVDDILDSGHTMYDCIWHYSTNCKVDVAVLVAKTSGLALCEQLAPVVSTVTIQDDAPFVYFPWETKPETKLC